MIDWLHPGLLLIAAGFGAAPLRGNARAALVLVAAAAAIAIALALPEGVLWRTRFLGSDLVPFAVDRLSRLFAVIFAIMAFGGALFAVNQTSRLEVPAAMIYAGAAIGVALGGDLATVFVFWELMAIGSTAVIWSAGTAAAGRASLRYAAVHLAGGALLMAGIAGHAAQTGSLGFERIALDSPAQWMILAGFLVNAGAWPLSAWLPDAYPEASWSGTVFLSAFTTKAAVYVLLRWFPGTELLIYVGLIMVFYGIVYALLENDMRRILAYSIVNQVGFMVTGIGIGTAMALNGAASHAFAHIIYKALLLMSAGAVLHATGRRKCTDLGGLFRTMPVTTLCGITGALAISGFPLTSGFVSKSMIGNAAMAEQLMVVWYLLAAASAGVFLHAGIKYPWFVFFQQDSGLRPPDPPISMRLAMALFALLCIGFGIWYAPLYSLLPLPVDYRPYTGAHVVGQLQLLLFSGLAFFVMLPALRRTLTLTLDVDWLYRRPGPAVARAATAAVSAVDGAVRAVIAASVSRVIAASARGAEGNRDASRPGTSGRMALWVALMLAAYLIAYYVYI